VTITSIHDTTMKPNNVIWLRHVACMGKLTITYIQTLKRTSLARPRCGWNGNIKMDLIEMGYSASNGITCLEKFPVVGTCKPGNIPLGSNNDGKCPEQISV